MNVGELIDKSEYLMRIKSIILEDDLRESNELNEYIGGNFGMIAGLNNYKLLNKIDIKEMMDEIKGNIKKLGESLLA